MDESLKDRATVGAHGEFVHILDSAGQSEDTRPLPKSLGELLREPATRGVVIRDEVDSRRLRKLLLVLALEVTAEQGTRCVAPS